VGFKLAAMPVDVARRPTHSFHDGLPLAVAGGWVLSVLQAGLVFN